MAQHITGVVYIKADTMDEQTFTEMLDELDANIKRIKSEIAREEAAFAELPI